MVPFGIVDSAGAIACSRVYPDIRHVLCRWHVDRYKKGHN